MNRRDELDTMYIILRNGCSGMNCTDCPGREYDHCGDYNKAVKLYDAGWRRQIEAEWVIKPAAVVCYECSNCSGELPFGLLSQYTPYCPNCGAKMKGEA